MTHCTYSTVWNVHDISDKAPKSLIYLNLSEFGKQLSQTAPVWIGQLYLGHDLDCVECTDM